MIPRYIGTFVIAVFVCCQLPNKHAGAGINCVVADSEIQRSAWIEAAIRVHHCDSFPKSVDTKTAVDSAIERLSHYDNIREKALTCRSELDAAYERASDRSISRTAACREAKRRRDYGIGAPGKASAAELVRELKKQVAARDAIIGIWVDDTHPAGFVAVTRNSSGWTMFEGYSSGQVVRSDPLETYRVRGALRAWRTKKPEADLGDIHTLIERPDGTIEYYEVGVGLEGSTPVLVGTPLKY